MPLEKSDFRNLPRVKLQGWANKEERIWTFLDNGVDFTSTDYGLAYIYSVKYGGEDCNIFIRPKSPLAIGLQQLITDEYPELKGLTVKVTKTTGKKQSDTRYKAEIVEPDENN
jgi:hypothetical protein